MNKEADKLLVFEWDTFKKIKGKTFGDIRRKMRADMGLEPSFLAITYRRNKCGAEKYVKAKYGKT